MSLSDRTLAIEKHPGIIAWLALTALLAIPLLAFSVARAAPEPPEGCTFSEGLTTCTSTQTHTEMRQRTVFSGCLAGPTGVPGRRLTVFEDTLLVTTTTTTSTRGLHGKVVDTQTTETTQLLASREVSSICEPL